MKHVYFIGIGGIGMSALARYYNHQGVFVAGYDRTSSSLTKQLEEEGISVHYEDSVSMIPDIYKKDKAATLVIYTPAVSQEMEEMCYFRNNGYEIIKRSKALGYIAANKHCLAIAGTHGKTTISTLLAHILTDSGSGCNAFLGGISKNYHSNLLLSKSPLLVAEADEFDRSFLQLFPDMAVITSTDPDHLDIYGNHSAIREAFSEFASQVKKDGTLVISDKAELSDKIKTTARIYRYSYENRADFYPVNKQLIDGGFFRFDIIHPEGVIEDCTLGIPGWVNVENAVAASAIAILYGTDPGRIRKALASFKGVERRFDIRINTPKYAYIDDYAHHPGEISAAISSIRNIFKGRKLTGIFQPHLYTRTRDFADGFAESLSMLDELILLDIYPARESPIEGVTSTIILEKVDLKEKILIPKEKLMETLSERKIDTLATFGAGDIDRYVAPITEYLKKECHA